MIFTKQRISVIAGIVVVFFLNISELIAQRGVGIGTAEPDESALLDLSSTSKGLLLPRMTLQQRNDISQPATGLVVYQTDLLSGIYIYNGKDWGSLSFDAAANLTTNSTTWNTTGNEVVGTENFLGTLDDAPLIFKVNNEFSGLLDNKRSNTFLGYKTGWATKSFNSVVIGAFALQRASTGNDNVVIGFQSMFNHENGQYNVAVGSLSLSSSVIGDKNTALGAMAGYRSKGIGNVFVGFQAGYFEQGDNKLYINNNASQTPLIYGDFEEKLVGINTSIPANKLSIKGDRDGDSGLQFQSLTSASIALSSNGKALSVDPSGNVILVTSSSEPATPTPVVTTFWSERGSSIQNLNDGNVFITKNLNVAETIESNRFEVQDGGIVFKKLNALSTPLNANGKSLSLDNFGNVILVKNEIPEMPEIPVVETNWQIVGNDVINKNLGTVFIKKDLEIINGLTTNDLIIKRGKIKFDNLTSNSSPRTSNGKVLTLDSNGNVILANDGIGNTDPSHWKKTDNRIELRETAQVIIGDGISKFPADYNLFVSKGILTERLRVAVPNSEKWADYVFKPDYRLMPLHKVEKFILTFGHLPNMYSADVAAEEGMDVLEMNVKLLEKVEELMLYAIDANKRIEGLEKRLAELEK